MSKKRAKFPLTATAVMMGWPAEKGLTKEKILENIKELHLGRPKIIVTEKIKSGKKHFYAMVQTEQPTQWPRLAMNALGGGCNGHYHIVDPKDVNYKNYVKSASWNAWPEDYCKEVLTKISKSDYWDNKSEEDTPNEEGAPVVVPNPIDQWDHWVQLSERAIKAAKLKQKALKYNIELTPYPGEQEGTEPSPLRREPPTAVHTQTEPVILL